MKMNNECENCGNVVSDQFAKVMGDNDNKVHRCMECVDADHGGVSILRHGGAAFQDIREVEYRMTAPKFE